MNAELTPKKDVASLFELLVSEAGRASLPAGVSATTISTSTPFIEIKHRVTAGESLDEISGYRWYPDGLEDGAGGPALSYFRISEDGVLSEVYIDPNAEFFGLAIEWVEALVGG